MATRLDRRKFLKNLRRSQLLSSAKFDEAVARLTDSDRPRKLARELVEPEA